MDNWSVGGMVNCYSVRLVYCLFLCQTDGYNDRFVSG